MVICKVAYLYGQKKKKKQFKKFILKSGLLKKYFLVYSITIILYPIKNPFFANFVCAEKKFSSGIQSASIILNTHD